MGIFKKQLFLFIIRDTRYQVKFVYFYILDDELHAKRVQVSLCCLIGFYPFGFAILEPKTDVLLISS